MGYAEGCDGVQIHRRAHRFNIQNRHNAWLLCDWRSHSPMGWRELRQLWARRASTSPALGRHGWRSGLLVHLWVPVVVPSLPALLPNPFRALDQLLGSIAHDLVDHAFGQGHVNV